MSISDRKSTLTLKRNNSGISFDGYNSADANFTTHDEGADSVNLKVNFLVNDKPVSLSKTLSLYEANGADLKGMNFRLIHADIDVVSGMVYLSLNSTFPIFLEVRNSLEKAASSGKSITIQLEKANEKQTTDNSKPDTFMAYFSPKKTNIVANSEEAASLMQQLGDIVAESHKLDKDASMSHFAQISVYGKMVDGSEFGICDGDATRKSMYKKKSTTK